MPEAEQPSSKTLHFTTSFEPSLMTCGTIELAYDG